jgi:DNA-binding transcriptional ArsR family regulator
VTGTCWRLPTGRIVTMPGEACPFESRPDGVLPGQISSRTSKRGDGRDIVYALTGICSVAYIKSVESVFEIIAEPNRRAILSLLVSSEQSVGEIERQLGMTQPTVSKHLRVLRDAGFVESTVDAQRRLYRLKPEPLQEVDAWLAPFRRFWSAHLDALERHLDRMDQSTRTKKKTRRRK